MPSIKVMVEGGKATPAPPLGPALGPLGVNIGQVVAAINEKTKEFEGMTVPVTVTVDPKTKEFTVEVGKPPTSQLILKELGIQKGGQDQKEKVGNLTLEQVKKIAKAKFGSDEERFVRQVIGTCQSMGVTVEGKEPKEFLKEMK
ncbi:50S ribosomal protein L11 [Nanoarchaeota archaeon]|nr:MAG: 50S ribosomal protein L11 [Nanoarchaeota archaeon]